MELVKSELLPSGLYHVEFDVGLHGSITATPEELSDTMLIFKRLLAGTTWIKTPRYSTRDTAGMTPEAKLLMLDAHHAAETTFLIDVVRRLADRVA